MAFCTNCGAELQGGKFCPECGTPVASTAITPMSPHPVSLVPQQFRATQKCGKIEVDSNNKLWKVKGIKRDPFKRSGSLLKSAAKGVLAVSTFGVSIAVEKTASGGSRIYKFEDLKDYEMLEDDEQLTSGGLGRVVVGHAIFGVAGAIAGGTTAKRKTKKVVNSLIVKITVNDFDNPSIMFNFLDRPAKTSSKDYQEAFKEAHRMVSLLNLIVSNA